MPAGTAVLTPFTRGAAQPQQGKRWTKRILPVGEVDYRGRTLKFTRDYLKSLAEAFTGQAYDQVPFQIAPDDNRHTNDPERFGGEITGMEARDDGLYVTLDATDRGDQVLRENPKLGVSARIVEEYARSDGQFFPAAIQHVLGTLDPRIPGLGAWQAVEASNDAAVTIDLSQLAFTGQDTPSEGTDSMAGFTPEQQARLGQLLNLPDGQWAALTAAQEVTAPAQGEDISDADLDALIESITDEELAELEAEAELLPEAQPEPVAAGLSQEAAMAIEMANTQSQDALIQLSEINAELDEQRYQADRRKYLDMGVPAVVVDKFSPLLKGSGHTIELANGHAVDAGQVAREGLTEYARMVQVLDLGAELGSGLDEPDQHGQAAEARDALVGQAKQIMGFR